MGFRGHEVGADEMWMRGSVSPGHTRGPESRRAARRAVDIACDLISTHWDRPVPSRCSDLSPHGMWLETTVPLEVGERVVVCFRPPRSGDMMVFARVNRVERDDRDERSGSSGVGLELVGLSALEQTELALSLRGLPPVLPGHKRDRRA